MYNDRRRYERKIRVQIETTKTMKTFIEGVNLIKRKGRIMGKALVYFDNEGKTNLSLPKGTSTVVTRNYPVKRAELIE